MPHPFGQLLMEFRTRKPGLSQVGLATLAGYDQAILTRMVQGKKDLTGPSGRERVVRIIAALRDEGVLATLDDANALLRAATMAPLFDGQPDEATLMQTLRPGNGTTFGEFLRFLRRRIQLTQEELGLAVGYSDAQITRLENGSRLPDLALVKTMFIEALGLQHEPGLAARLVELAAQPRSKTPQATRPGNLPTQLTRFIGRKREVSAVAHLLNTNRLVTLTGSGGVGKTRLAIEVGGALPNQFSDGVWLVELAPLADGALVPYVIAAVFKIPDRPRCPPIDALTTFLVEKQMLLILDNCEHLIEVCAQLADALLRYCPQLHMLATSREVLRIPGEVTWRVPPLDMPDPAHLPSLARAAEYDALQLFVEHAALAQAGFTLTPDNLPTVARICQQLDGMPLAIEMAAVQVLELSVEGIAAALDDRLAILTTGSRTALPRHQTLQRAIEWSYQLLSEPERVLLARLSVFAGGWTAKAATSVCGPDSLPLLLQLARKSLVVTAMREGQQCYALLESVRQFAAVKLHEYGEAETLDAHHRHLAYFLAMAEETMDLGGRHVDAWGRRMDREYDNLRAAFTWASTREGQGEMALRFVSALRPFWFNRGHIAEGMTWIDTALARGGMTSAAVQARALLAKAGLSIHLGDLAGMATAGETSLALFRQTEDQLGLAWCLELLANNTTNSRAQTLAEESLPLFRKLGSLDGEGRALRALGASVYRAGNHMQAAQLYEQAIATMQQIDNRFDIALCLQRLYDVNPGRALELCMQELSRLRNTSDEADLIGILTTYGLLCMCEGEYERARPLLEECLQFRQHIDVVSLHPYGWEFALALNALGLTELLLGHSDQALVCLNQARMAFQEAGMVGARTVARFFIASVTIVQGDLTLAEGEVHECLQLFHKGGFRSAVVCSLVQAADLARQRGNTQRASRLLGAVKTFGHEVEIIHYQLDRFRSLWYRHAQRTIIEPTLAAARAQLGDAAFDAAYAEGQQMTLDQAVAYALQEGSAGAPD